MADHNTERDNERGVIVKERSETQRPRLYKVLFHNDDFTTMEFVVHTLMRFFEKTRTDATRVMLQIHHSGTGLAGCYAYEIAETKVHQTMEYAREHEYPLLVTMEPD